MTRVYAHVVLGVLMVGVCGIYAAMPEPQVIDNGPKVQEQQSSESASDAQKAAKPSLSMEGIDTVDIEGDGNWLLKRKILEDAMDLIEKQSKLFTKILDSQMDYKIKHNQLSNDYDAFITKLGFDLGELDKSLSVMLERMEQERVKDGDLSESEREVVHDAEQNKQAITQLREDLKTLQDFDTKITEVMSTVDKQMQTGNGYQNQMWKNFQEIKKVLSDERAEELYYNSENLFKNLQSILTYLKTTLAQYFSDQISQMHEHMVHIQQRVEDLKNKGIDLQKEVNSFEQQDIEKEHQRQVELEKEIREKAAQECAAKQSNSGIVEWFKKLFNSIINTLSSFVTWIVSSIKGLFVKEPITVRPEVPAPHGEVLPQNPASPGETK